MCAAHWPAVQALAATCDLASIVGLPGCTKLAVSLAICVGKGPPDLAADADLRRMFGAMMGYTPQVKTSGAVVPTNASGQATWQDTLPNHSMLTAGTTSCPAAYAHHLPYNVRGSLHACECPTPL